MSANEPEAQKNGANDEISEDQLDKVSGGNVFGDFVPAPSDHSSLGEIERQTGTGIDIGVDAHGNRIVKI